MQRFWSFAVSRRTHAAGQLPTIVTGRFQASRLVNIAVEATAGGPSERWAWPPLRRASATRQCISMTRVH